MDDNGTYLGNIYEIYKGATRLRGISFATCTLDILKSFKSGNITIWLICRHVYCNLQAGYTVTLIFGVLQPSGLVVCSPPGVAPLPPSDLGLRILGSQPVSQQTTRRVTDMSKAFNSNRGRRQGRSLKI